MKGIDQLTQPIKAMKLRYLPLLIIYFAYGCSTFSAIGEAFFVKERLNLSAEALLMIGVWFTLPWTIKMLFGQLVDSVPLLGSSRKIYVYIAGGLMASGSLLMAGLAGQWPWVVHLASPNALYITAGLITVVGVVLQDVVADAMSVEVVEREGRDDDAINRDLAMVQLLGRLSLSLGMFIVSGLGGWLAQVMSYEHLFLLTLVIPVIGISGCLLIKIDTPPRKKINWVVLGSGIVFAIVVVSLGVGQAPYAQEVIFAVSLTVVVSLLYVVVKHVDRQIFRYIIAASIVIFVFRAMPNAGPGAQWFMMDILGFNKAFFGTLAQIGAGLAIIGLWVFAKPITEKPISLILTVLTILLFFLSTPLISMYYGFHEWTMMHFGFGSQTIAIVDTALSSPFIQLSMVPVLALVARNAPRGNAATWFALMASFMNLALSAGGMLSKYLNRWFVVSREVKDAAGQVVVAADYSQLGHLLIITAVLGLVLPLSAIWVLTRHERRVRAVS